MSDETTSLPAAAEEVRAWSLTPESLHEAQEYAKLIASSELVPKDYRGKPGNVLVAVQMGAELGLSPMQSLQGIAVINGRPSVWGDALIGLVLASPVCEYVREEFDEQSMAAICRAKRRGSPQEVVRVFSMEDAKVAGLAGREGPWRQYPRRMLQMRARGFALRDAFADVLKGLAIAEEVGDIEPPTGYTVEQEAPAPRSRVAALRQRVTRTPAIAHEAAPAPAGDEQAPEEAQEAGPASDDASRGLQDVLAIIAKASNAADLRTCADAVNELSDRREKVQAGKALAARAAEIG